MGTRRLRMVLLAGMGMAAAACGAAVATRETGKASPPATMAAMTVTEPASQEKPVLVDVDRPWMKWGDARPDPGRGRLRADPTGFWSDEKALQDKVPVAAAMTPATREAIPKPVEPGSTVGSLEVVPEPAEVVGAGHAGKSR